MDFNFFLNKIALPLIIAVVLFSVSQLSASFVSSSDFYSHKVQNASDISGINAKIDYLIKSQDDIDRKIDIIIEQLHR